MFRSVGLAFSLLLTAAVIAVGDKEDDRLENCGVVMEEILDLPDGIPQDLLEKAECVVVIPSVIKVLGIGGGHGRGAMTCRAGKAFDGPWGLPAMYALDAGGFGPQLGGAATDLVLLVMNGRGVNALLNGKVTLGGTVSAAAGTTGREATASTDASWRAEILGYSRSRGLFAGASLEGASLRPDDDATAQVYGRTLSARAIVTGHDVAVPPSGRRLVNVLHQHAARDESKQMTNR